MRPFIKICGIVDPEDAYLCGKFGVDFIGLILWKGSSRHVDNMLACEIVKAAQESSVITVGVFVEGNVKEIEQTVSDTGIEVLQLHRLPSKGYIGVLSQKYPSIYTVSVETNGEISPPEKEQLNTSLKYADHLLYDHGMGGTGEAFFWDQFSPPKGKSWILAGGLTPQNVRQAVVMLHPDGIDVSSGVQKRNSLRKDPALIQQLIKEIELL